MHKLKILSVILTVDLAKIILSAAFGTYLFVGFVTPLLLNNANIKPPKILNNHRNKIPTEDYLASSTYFPTYAIPQEQLKP